MALTRSFSTRKRRSKSVFKKPPTHKSVKSVKHTSRHTKPFVGNLKHRTPAYKRIMLSKHKLTAKKQIHTKSHIHDLDDFKESPKSKSSAHKSKGATLQYSFNPKKKN